MEALPQGVRMLPPELEKLELDELQSQLLPHTNTVTPNLPPLPRVATVTGVPMTFQVQNTSCAPT